MIADSTTPERRCRKCGKVLQTSNRQFFYCPRTDCFRKARADYQRVRNAKRLVDNGWRAKRNAYARTEERKAVRRAYESSDERKARRRTLYHARKAAMALGTSVREIMIAWKEDYRVCGTRSYPKAESCTKTLPRNWTD